MEDEEEEAEEEEEEEEEEKGGVVSTVKLSTQCGLPGFVFVFSSSDERAVSARRTCAAVLSQRMLLC